MHIEQAVNDQLPRPLSNPMLLGPFKVERVMARQIAVLEQGQPTHPVQGAILRYFRVDQFRDRREQVHSDDQLVAGLPGRNRSRPVHDPRPAMPAVEQAALILAVGGVAPAALTPLRRIGRDVVAGEEDERLFGQAALLQPGHDLSDRIIDHRDGSDPEAPIARQVLVHFEKLRLGDHGVVRLVVRGVDQERLVAVAYEETRPVALQLNCYL